MPPTITPATPTPSIVMPAMRMPEPLLVCSGGGVTTGIAV